MQMFADHKRKCVSCVEPGKAVSTMTSFIDRGVALMETLLKKKPADAFEVLRDAEPHKELINHIFRASNLGQSGKENWKTAWETLLKYASPFTESDKNAGRFRVESK